MAGTRPWPHLREQVREQRRNVLPAAAQRRQAHGQPVEPREQIGTEAALADHVHERLLPRDDDAHVDRNRTGLAERLHLPLLEHAQELGLERHRQIGDLVEQQRAPLGAAEEPGAGPVGAREGPPPVSEQLTLGEPFRERGAVDRDEGARTPAPLVEAPRATTSLPVPVSPSSTMGRSLVAACLRGASAARRLAPPKRPGAISPKAPGAAATTPIQPPRRTTSPRPSGDDATGRPLTRTPLRLPRSTSRTSAPGALRRRAA